MSAREFVDTNILVYFHDRSAGVKQAEASELLGGLWASGRGCVSIQVLQEFYVVSTGKLGMPSEKAEAQVRHLSKWRVHAPLPNDITEAIELQRKLQFSFWDAMVVQSAVRLGCKVIWTEDLNAGQVIDGIEIRNPFAEASTG